MSWWRFFLKCSAKAGGKWDGVGNVVLLLHRAHRRDERIGGDKSYSWSHTQPCISYPGWFCCFFLEVCLLRDWWGVGDGVLLLHCAADMRDERIGGNKSFSWSHTQSWISNPGWFCVCVCARICMHRGWWGVGDGVLLLNYAEIRWENRWWQKLLLYHTHSPEFLTYSELYIFVEVCVKTVYSFDKRYLRLLCPQTSPVFCRRHL